MLAKPHNAIQQNFLGEQASTTRNRHHIAQRKVDWAVKMRIRPSELETSICDVKYHVSLHLTTLASKLQNRRPSSQTSRTAAAHRRASAAPPPSVRSVIGLVSITVTRSFRLCQNPSDLLVQIDGGILIPVVDLIDDLPPPTV
ncbi:histone-lysine N-methyltransferase ASHH3-like [Dorcoceras hygrometricum]|uniref:Histone-lysine N-methyltransferase ASHH3-like n=1 Tax=Dorcoceras hygrometricum TaxID=472368 RepID=A0A2Z7C4G0_9LAMI|nr:histone-lysine N-methyltransferase ASHH3-like [Dorcoceras hygrometricum]